MAQTIDVPRLAPNVAVTITLCFLVAMVEGFDIQAIGVAAPRMAPQFGLSAQQLGWIFAISNVGLVIGASFGGWLADRVGRKPVFIGGVLTFAVFTLLTSVTGNFPLLFAARFCTGLGFGAVLPNLMAVAAEVSAPDKRASTASMVFCGMPLGGGSLALFTQVLPPDFDWQTLFIVGGVLPLLLVPALFLLMPETLRKDSRADTPNDIRTALFADHRTAPTLLLWLAFFPTLVILYLILNWLPTLVAANGLDRAIAPQASLWFNFAGVPGAIFFGRLVDRHDARWPLTAAFLGLIASLFVLSTSHGLMGTLLLSGAAGFLLLGANYALYGVAATYYPRHLRATGSGAAVAVGRTGSVVGPLFAGMLLGSGTSASGVVAYMIPVAAVACAAVIGLSFCRKPAQE